jgi:tRNA(Ile)-lysidine synthase
MPPSQKIYKIHPLLAAIEKAIKDYDMLSRNDSVLVAVSGGPDSMALLHALVLLAPRYSLKLGIGHLNHCLRPDACDGDAEFVLKLADTLNLPVYSQKVDVGAYRKSHRLSMEEAARRCRYTFLFDTARKKGFRKIALGHQADDNAEQVLMYLLRGSGPLGMAGIPPVRDDGVIRPLIGARREKIMHFLQANQIVFRNDFSNLDESFTRNRIRHSLIPNLARQFNPRIVAALNRLSTITREEEKWITDFIDPIYADTLAAQSSDGLLLSSAKLNQLATPVLRRVVRKAIEAIKGDRRRITLTHVEAVAKLLGKGVVSKGIDLPDGIRIELSNTHLVISRSSECRRKRKTGNTMAFKYAIYDTPKTGTGHAITIRETGAHLEFRAISIEDARKMHTTGHLVAFFDMDMITLPLQIRNFKPGDRFQPLGLDGTQKVKKYFINCKVPKKERLRIPIVCSGNKIIWIAGHRIDDAFKLTPRTKRVLRGEICLPNK